MSARINLFAVELVGSWYERTRARRGAGVARRTTLRSKNGQKTRVPVRKCALVCFRPVFGTPSSARCTGPRAIYTVVVEDAMKDRT